MFRVTVECKKVAGDTTGRVNRVGLKRKILVIQLWPAGELVSLSGDGGRGSATEDSYNGQLLAITGAQMVNWWGVGRMKPEVVTIFLLT